MSYKSMAAGSPWVPDDGKSYVEHATKRYKDYYNRLPHQKLVDHWNKQVTLTERRDYRRMRPMNDKITEQNDPQRNMPEISFDKELSVYGLNNEPITMQQALEHWNAVDCQWTVGAHMRMIGTTIPNLQAEEMEDEDFLDTAAYFWFLCGTRPNPIKRTKSMPKTTTVDNASFEQWHEILHEHARTFDGSAADADAWREYYDNGMTPEECWFNAWGEK